MGSLTQVSRPTGLVETYAYDGLGQRLQAWNNLYRNPIYGEPEEVWVPGPGYPPNDPPPLNALDGPGGHWETVYPIIGYTPDTQLTEYDASGRVVFTRAFGGEVTTTRYDWNATVAVAGRTLGGWTQTTGYMNGRTLIETSDVYGRTTAKTDLGYHAWSYVYDVAGRLLQTGTGGVFSNYVYLNTGLLGGRIVGPVTPDANTNWSRRIATYGYDKAGRRIAERLIEETGVVDPGEPEPGVEPPHAYRDDARTDDLDPNRIYYNPDPDPEPEPDPTPTPTPTPTPITVPVY